MTEPCRDAILVFVRAPVLGSVKTRLAAEIGDEAALAVYRRLAEHALEQARALVSARVRVHVTPADACGEVRAWLGPGADYLPQHGAGLGERMRAAFAEAFAAGFERVVIIGSDLPALTADLLRDAFAGLDGHRCVLGPSRDGGYWLLGLREMSEAPFDGIAWSTEAVFAATLARLDAAGIAPALLPVLRDVDTAADLPDAWRAWAAAATRVPA